MARDYCRQIVQSQPYNTNIYLNEFISFAARRARAIAEVKWKTNHTHEALQLLHFFSAVFFIVSFRSECARCNREAL